jgi:hypothetical protein
VTTACTSATGQDQHNHNDGPPQSIRDLGKVGSVYLKTINNFPKSLPLPAGQSFPMAVPSSWNPKAVVDSSYGQTLAYFYWRCSWSAKFLQAYAASDQVGQTTALDQLEKWTTTSFFREHVVEDPNAGWQQLLIAPARLGDVTMMRAFDTADCGYYRQVNGKQP